MYIGSKYQLLVHMVTNNIIGIGISQKKKKTQRKHINWCLVKRQPHTLKNKIVHKLKHLHHVHISFSVSVSGVSLLVRQRKHFEDVTLDSGKLVTAIFKIFAACFTSLDSQQIAGYERTGRWQTTCNKGPQLDSNWTHYSAWPAPYALPGRPVREEHHVLVFV